MQKTLWILLIGINLCAAETEKSLDTPQSEASFHLENQHRECFIGKISADQEDEKGSMACFINIPKNASTFLRKSVFLDRKSAFKWFTDIDTTGYKYFVCVRNPMYRPISSYTEIMKLRPDGFPHVTKNTEFFKAKNQLFESFRYFLDEVDGNLYDTHVCLQCDRLTEKHLSLNDMDFIFCFEALFADLKTFTKIFGIPIRNRPERVTPSSTKAALKRFINSNPDIQEKIRKIWAKDFEFYEAAKKRRKEILNSF